MVRILTREEVKKHKGATWVIIHNSVYDVSEFINEHPGGEEVLLERAGGEASEGFEDAGHTPDARSRLQKLKVGEISTTEHKDLEQKTEDWLAVTKDPNELDTEPENSYAVPIVIVVVALLACFYYYYF
ncbi:hypothetical protein RI129_004719 [Pyrocoelia pectoralis]|uniref:Cytochrome b5 n=1 Tax=Pyrocoelia pectoralis TaxID=417401 RepID=A0AAN7VCW3_9COLE